MSSFTSAIPYIKKAEGGLSRATTDTASKYPAPWTYQGKTGWHTNKGITYQTFEGMSKVLKYANTANNFFAMPNDIWLGIYKEGYWKPILADLVNSQAIANALVDAAWAHGVTGASSRLKTWLQTQTLKEAIDLINARTTTPEKEAKFYDDFINQRKKWFLAINQPANHKGWINRMDTLLNEGYSLLKKKGEA